MLGKDISSIFAEDIMYELYGTVRFNTTNLSNITQIEIDLTELNKIEKLLTKVNPEIIIHCAAHVNVDDCDNNKHYVHKLHIGSTQYLASFQPNKTKFIYISSDSLYDGKHGNYTETDNATPLNYYAKTKREGELAALSANENTIIIRTNIYGFHMPKGKSLVEWAVENWIQNKAIYGFNDVYFNPLYTKQLAKLIKALISIEGFSGILHAGSVEIVSKFDFLIKLAEVLGFSKELINEISVESFNFPAARPKNTTLNTKKIKDLLGYIPELYIGLNELKRDRENYIFKGEQI